MTNRLRYLTLFIILADNLLNWFLGILLTFFPHSYLAWLAPTNQLPISVCIFNGVCFLVFSIWQVKTFLLPWRLDTKNLKIAAWLAWLPAIGLSLMLLTPLELYSYRKLILWLGNAYMVALGYWYWRVANKIK